MNDQTQTPSPTPTGAASALTVELGGFRAGARAMFDALMYRVANHWHPAHQEDCDRDNAWVTEWAADALEEVSPDDCVEWKSIHQARREGYEAGKRAAWASIPRTVIGRLVWAFKTPNNEVRGGALAPSQRNEVERS